jgi:CheY-like chemotaxis protein
MEAIGQLAGGVAHDFNNILAVVLMNASELSDDANATPAQAEGLNEIIQAAERGANLTRQMLTFSRRQVMQMHALDLNDVVVGVTKMLQRIIGEDIVLQTRLAPDDMLVWGDSGMIEQVLLNLAVNARDAMPEGGHLTIELSNSVVDELAAKAHKGKAGDFVLLTVRDDGFGISAEHLARIFEPFYTTKAAGKGTGLGLATLHGIVEQHHGWVVVESEVGQGTAFFIYLPRLLATKQLPGEQTAPVILNGGTETILVVEDEKSLRTLAVRVLKHSGYRVLEASDGPEALKVWHEHYREVDLLVTDVIMPGGMSGGKLADQLRSEKPGLKVIYMSGYSGDVAGIGLNLRDGRQFLQKPFPPSKLVQTVREYLDAV